MSTPPRPGFCPKDCREHPEHVYILCYGRPVYVADRDYIRGETSDYPIDHYVGYTRQQPPVNRVRRHANRSAHHIAGLFPGTLRDELRWKLTGRCPACGADLWYFATPKPDPSPH